MAVNYENAGVNLEAGYEVVRRIKSHVASTARKGSMGGIGSFGGMFDLSALGLKEPVLVSGTDGVGTKLLIAEELGYQPGEFEVISAGVNHLNWLFDIRRKGTGKSCMKEFLELVGKSEYWKKRFKSIPPQMFTLEVLKTFGVYPIGYDDHIIEYMQFFYEKDEWEAHQYEALTEMYRKMAEKKVHVLEQTRLLGKDYEKPPFPVDPDHPYYAENPCGVIKSFETNTPLYFDAIVTPNCGAVDNLPKEAVLDVPAVAIGGEVRPIHVGALPPGPLEICRRQVALHEMIVQAANEGSHSLAEQVLCLDPYVHSITQARAIWKDYYETYKEDLTDFR